MIYAILILSLLFAIRSGDKHHRRANELGLRVAELDMENHDMALIIQDNLKRVMTETPAWDKSDGPGEHAECIIIDDIWGVTIDDSKFSSGLNHTIMRREGEPTLFIQSTVHEDDAILASLEAHKQEIIDSMGIPPHLLGNALDSTLNYSWFAPSQIRGTHVYSFRSGEWADIIGVDIIEMRSGPRPCFRAIYDDGHIDTVAMCDFDNYEVK